MFKSELVCSTGKGLSWFSYVIVRYYLILVAKVKNIISGGLYDRDFTLVMKYELMKF